MGKESSKEEDDETKQIWFVGSSRKKRERMKHGIKYCKAWNTSKHIILTNWAKTYILSINIYSDYNYKPRTMTQDYSPHPLHINIDERRMPHRSQRHTPAWVAFYHWSRKDDVCIQFSGGDNQ